LADFIDRLTSALAVVNRLQSSRVERQSSRSMLNCRIVRTRVVYTVVRQFPTESSTAELT